MFSFNKKQFIFKQSSGKVWNFYYDEKMGLCYSILTRRNTWTEPVSVQKNIHPSFYADMDYEDCFHLIYQDNHGNIFYSKIENGNINAIPILNSKQPSPYDKHLFLIPGKNLIHIFFTVYYNDYNLLTHQIISRDSSGKPKVIDYVAKNDLPYVISCDKAGNIYAFYQASDGKYMQTGFKKYMPSQGFWGEFTPLTRYSGDSELARAIIDNKNILHIIYQRRTDKQVELVYQQKVPDKNILTGEAVIYSSAQPFPESSILWINGNIIVFWIRNDIINYSLSGDDGNTWSKPAKFSFHVGRQIFCFSYKSNSPQENDKIFAADIPGSFINGYKLAFYEEPAGSVENLSPTELKTMIVDSLKLLKTNIDELKEANSEIRQTLSKLSLAHQSLDRELSKNSVRLNFIENEINQVKNMNKQLELHREALSELKRSFESSIAKENKLSAMNSSPDYPVFENDSTVKDTEGSSSE